MKNSFALIFPLVLISRILCQDCTSEPCQEGINCTSRSCTLPVCDGVPPVVVVDKVNLTLQSRKSYHCIPTNIFVEESLQPRTELFISIGSDVDSDDKDAKVILEYEYEDANPFAGLDDPPCVHDSTDEREVEINDLDTVFPRLKKHQLSIRVIPDEREWPFRFYPIGLHRIWDSFDLPVPTEFDFEGIRNGTQRILFLYVLILIDGKALAPSSMNSFFLCEETDNGYITSNLFLFVKAIGEEVCSTITSIDDGLFYHLELKLNEPTMLTKSQYELIVSTANSCADIGNPGNLGNYERNITIINNDPVSSTTTPQPTETPHTDNKAGGLSGGAIAGIVIAIIAVIAVTVVAIVIFIKFHPRRKPDTGVRLNDIAQGEEGMAGGTQRDIKDQEDDKLKQQENSVNHTPEEIENAGLVYVYKCCDYEVDDFTDMLYSTSGETKGDLPQSTQDDILYTQKLIALLRDQRCKTFYFIYQQSPEWLKVNNNMAWELMRDLTVRSYGPDVTGKMIMIRIGDDDCGNNNIGVVNGPILTLTVSINQLKDTSLVKSLVEKIHSKARVNIDDTDDRGYNHSQTPPTMNNGPLKFSPDLESQPPSYTSTPPTPPPAVPPAKESQQPQSISSAHPNLELAPILKSIENELVTLNKKHDEQLEVNKRTANNTGTMAEEQSGIKQVVEDTNDRVTSLKMQAVGNDQPGNV